MFTSFYVHFRCFKCDHNTLSLHPRKVWGDYVVYQSLLITCDSFHTWETIGSGNDVLYSNIAAPSPLFHKEKRSVVKSFKLARKFQQIPSFLLNTPEKIIFFPKYFGGAQCSKLTVVHSSKTSKMYHWTSENYDYSYLWTSRQFLVFICFVFYEF